jgi:hypothetical protein
LWGKFEKELSAKRFVGARRVGKSFHVRRMERRLCGSVWCEHRGWWEFAAVRSLLLIYVVAGQRRHLQMSVVAGQRRHLPFASAKWSVRTDNDFVRATHTVGTIGVTGDDIGSGSETVLEGIHGRTGLAFGSSRAGGITGVDTIYSDTTFRRHDEILSQKTA